jgi:hypothetical protein
MGFVRHFRSAILTQIALYSIERQRLELVRAIPSRGKFRYFVFFNSAFSNFTARNSSAIYT